MKHLYSLLLITLFFTTTNLSSGEIQDYFKKCPEKGKNHSMRNIDFIYTINLDQRPEKYKTCTDQLDPYNIHPYRFSAVNGWELSLEAINDVGVRLEKWMDKDKWGTSYLFKDNGKPFHEKVHTLGQTYFCHCLARGSIGICLSHLSILQDAYDSGYNTIWVMEDDIEIIQNPHILSDLIEKLDAQVGKNNWDILFTDQDTKNKNGEYIPCLSYAWRPNFKPKNPARFAKRTEVSAEFRQVGARYGAYSMIVRRSGMKKILNFIKTYRIFLPYDMDFYLPNDIKIFSVKNDVVSTQPRALSDNGGPNYQNKQ